MDENTQKERWKNDYTLVTGGFSFTQLTFSAQNILEKSLINKKVLKAHWKMKLFSSTNVST